LEQGNNQLHQQKTTWFYVDEFHLLLKEERAAAHSIESWFCQARKQKTPRRLSVMVFLF